MVTRTHIVAFVISCVISCVATFIVRSFARRYKLMDRPDPKRKIHSSPVPSLGGIGIFCGFFAPITGLLIYINKFSHSLTDDFGRIAALYIGGAMTLLLGVYDDIRGADALKKLAAQSAIAVVVFALGYRIEVLNVPALGVVDLGYFSFPVTCLWVVAIMNAMNLIDGLDGLASGVSFIALMTIFIMSVMDGNHLAGLFTASLAGAVLGFWFFNFNPASIFMGDSGSLFLGFVLSIMSISATYKGSIALGILPVIALGIPVLDIFMAVIRRTAGGRSIFKADREHIHHRLLSLGLSQRQVVAIIYTFCLLLSMMALILKQRQV